MTRSGFVAMIVGSALALGQLVALPAAADDAAARRQALEPYFRNYRPSGAGPFPAILMVSGCSGFTPSIAPQVYTRAAERWRSKGYVVVFVDYLSARGLPNCPRFGRGERSRDRQGRTGRRPLSARTALREGFSDFRGGLDARGRRGARGTRSIDRRREQPIAVRRRLLPLLPRPSAMAGQGACIELDGRPRRSRTAGGLPTGLCATAARHRASGARLSGSTPRFRYFRLAPLHQFGSETLGYNAAADAAAAREVEQFMSRKTD